MKKMTWQLKDRNLTGRTEKRRKKRKIKDDGGDLGDHICKVPSLTSPDSFESLCYDGQHWEGMRFNRFPLA
jgi:hypothetical protein